jgi:hypothetical protein
LAIENKDVVVVDIDSEALHFWRKRIS